MLAVRLQYDIPTEKENSINGTKMNLFYFWEKLPRPWVEPLEVKKCRQ
jgi:hypothetical protein